MQESLTREELLGLLEAARKKRERDWLLLLVGYWHGLRVSEIINLTPAHFKDGFITIQRLKGSKKTTHPLMPHQNPLLDERTALPKYLSRLSDRQARLFPISRMQVFNIIRRDGASAGIPEHKLHPHVLKHSIARHMVREAGVENLQQYLGHKSGASTMEYLKASDAEASDAVARAEERRSEAAASGLGELEKLTAAEQLRRVLRMLEQSETPGRRKRSKGVAGGLGH